MKIAVVQEAPVYLDLEASLEKAVDLIGRASGEGARLVVFPEAWLPGYPNYIWALRPGTDRDALAALHSRLLANAVDMSKDGLAPIRAAARDNGVVVVAGYDEIDGRTSGSTLFNAVAIIDSDGTVLNAHRKLMPTNPERTVWGFGDGSGLRVVDTAVGRVGALICWENYMPLARMALYAQRIEIYCAPTFDTGETWLATMKHIAKEGGCWVVGCSTPLERSDIPLDLPCRDIAFPEEEVWVNDGDAVVVQPSNLRSRLVAGPSRREKGVLYAEIDPQESLAARRAFDVAGHYSRPDVFSLHVNRARQQPVTFEDPD